VWLQVVTVSGRTAALVSKYRPHCPILCATPDDGVARKLQMYRGLHAVVVPPGSSVAQCKRLAIAAAKVHGIAESGDRVVSVHGAHTMPGGDSGQAGVQVTMAHVL
jgi:pyruvate kinase